MLRVVLTNGDLGHVRVPPRAAPMRDLPPLLREPLLDQKAIEPNSDQAKVDLVRSLVAQPCAPGFVLPATSDVDDATETVAGPRRDAIRRDLDDNATAGFPLPGWTTDLTLPGYAGTGARHSVHAALAHVVSAYIEPRTRWATPVVTPTTRAWRRGDDQRLAGDAQRAAPRHPVSRIRAGSGSVLPRGCRSANIRRSSQGRPHRHYSERHPNHPPSDATRLVPPAPFGRPGLRHTRPAAAGRWGGS